MKILTSTSRGWLRNTTATGLVPLLLLASLSGCTARHLPDWSTVQAVKPNTKTEVTLYKDRTPPGTGQKFRGRVLSTTDNSVTLELTERYYRDGRIRTFQKSDVRKVLTPRSIGERWPGWAAFFTSAAVGALITVPAGEHLTGATKVLATFILPIPISIPFFIGSHMGSIYEVPPRHRDSKWRDGAPTVEPKRRTLSSESELHTP